MYLLFGEGSIVPESVKVAGRNGPIAVLFLSQEKADQALQKLSGHVSLKEIDHSEYLTWGTKHYKPANIRFSDFLTLDNVKACVKIDGLP